MLPNYNNFGRVTLYSGLIGSGMTLAAITHVIELKKANPELEIISNIKLYNIDYKTFNLEDIVKDFPKLYNKVILLDNAYITLDSRLSQSRINKLLVYLLAQSRSRKINWVLTSSGLTKKSSEHKLDKRWRRNITNHFRVHCYTNHRLKPEVRTLILHPYRIPKVYNYFKYYSTLDQPINPRLNK